MVYNSGWSNLIPQELKYTPRLAAQADNLLRLAKQLADEHGILLDAAFNLLSTRNPAGIPQVEEED